MLIYDMSTFHRGSRPIAEGIVRFTHHINYRASDAPWVGYREWANYGLLAEMQHFIEQASPRQREMLGFPPPGNAYWNEQTLAGVGARYPGMNLIPYLEAAGISEAQVEAARERLGRRGPAIHPSPDTGVVSSTHSVNALSGAVAEYWQGVADYCQWVADYYATYVNGRR
jgi:hypothetical protein